MSISTEITRIKNAKAEIKSSIENKGVSVPADAKLETYKNYIDSIPSGGPTDEHDWNYDTIFYDYDGTELYSYTRDELQALTELPPLPDRTSEGLVCQGWNWTLEDLKAEPLGIDVGPYYITDDRKTRVWFDNTDIDDTVCLTFGNGTATPVVVDWGDGTVETYTSVSNTNSVFHDYTQKNENMCITIGDGNKVNLDKYTSTGNRISIIVPKDFQTAGDAPFSRKIKKIYYGNTDYIHIGQASNLESVTFPKGYRINTNDALSFCPKLKFIVLPESNISYNMLFRNNGSLIAISIPKSNSLTYCRMDYNCNLRRIPVHSNMNAVLGGEFLSKNKRTKFTAKNTSGLSSTVLSYSQNKELDLTGFYPQLGGGNFLYYSAIEKITMDDRVTTIPTSAFQQCHNLKNVNFPENIITFNGYCFQHCRNLEGIVKFQNTVTIGNDAFRECVNLKFDFSNMTKINTIQSSAFQYCQNLKGNITFPSTLKILNGSAFTGTMIENVDLSACTLTTFGSAFYDCHLLKSLKFPVFIGALPANCCQRCYALREVEIPEGYTGIGGNAFTYTSIEEIVLPDSVASIQNYAFSGCSSLKKVVFGEKLASIQNYAFNQCTQVMFVDARKCLQVPIPTSSLSFNTNVTIVVPDNLLDNFKTTNYWKNYANIIPASEYVEE